MNKNGLLKLTALMLAMILVLAACGGGTAPVDKNGTAGSENASAAPGTENGPAAETAETALAEMTEAQPAAESTEA